jgi:hypothetical protein
MDFRASWGVCDVWVVKGVGGVCDVLGEIKSAKRARHWSQPDRFRPKQAQKTSLTNLLVKREVFIDVSVLMDIFEINYQSEDNYKI